MLHYLGLEFLRELLDYYSQRLALALERGYSTEGSKYYWLYAELDLRVNCMRQVKLFLDALPRFMVGNDEEMFFSYVVNYSHQILSDPSLSVLHDQSDPHPFFNASNPYWADLQQALDNFGVEYESSILPLTYIDLCEYVICTLRLYFQIRERCCGAIDRDKFDEVMHMRTALAPTA